MNGEAGSPSYLVVVQTPMSMGKGQFILVFETIRKMCFSFLFFFLQSFQSHTVHKVELFWNPTYSAEQIEVDGRGAQRGAPRSHHNNDKDGDMF